MSTPMKQGMVRKKPGKLTLGSDKVQQSFIVDPSGRFQTGKMDDKGFKKDNEEEALMSLNYLDLELLDILGRGASSYVQRARNKITGVMMALKVIDVFDKEKRHQLLKEIKTLHLSDSPYLVSFYGAFYKDGQISIGIELMDAGSLEDILRKVGKFPESALAIISKQVLHGFDYLHRIRHGIHRDIKPSNICLNRQGIAKLTDFGVATDLNSKNDAQTFVGTFVYMSPERISGKPYQFNSDLWSFGLCLLECAIGRFPYPSSMGYLDMVQSIVHDPAPRLPDQDNYSEEFESFLDACLQKDPERRPSAQELLQHPWLSAPAHSKFNISDWLANGLK